MIAWLLTRQLAFISDAMIYYNYESPDFLEFHMEGQGCIQTWMQTDNKHIYILLIM